MEKESYNALLPEYCLYCEGTPNRPGLHDLQKYIVLHQWWHPKPRIKDNENDITCCCLISFKIVHLKKP